MRRIGTLLSALALASTIAAGIVTLANEPTPAAASTCNKANNEC
jgi:hypothetical protein